MNLHYYFTQNHTLQNDRHGTEIHIGPLHILEELKTSPFLSCFVVCTK
jgi:hypothetical protein